MSDDRACFKDRGDGLCVRCARTIRWHAGQWCYSSSATGMPEPALRCEPDESAGMAQLSIELPA